MSYPKYIKDEAFTLDCAGMTANAIAKNLKRRYRVKLTASTVQKWMNDPQWAGRKKEITKVNHDIVMEIAKDTRQEMLEDAINIQRKLLVEVDRLGGTSLEGTAYAWKSISEFILKLEDDTKFSPHFILGVILQAVRETPEVAPVFQAHWQTIQEKIKDTLNLI